LTFLRRLAWTRYRLPLVAAFATAHGALPVREGLILRLTTDVGVVGLGDAAPLDAFGGGSLDAAEAALRRVAPRLDGLDLADLPAALDGLLARPASAALRCGLETAALDACGRGAGLPVATLLAPNGTASVAVNAVVGDGTPEATVRAARAAVVAGFGTIKLKVGVGDPARDAARVAAVRAAIGPEPRLRLDANGGWTPEAAIACLRVVAPLDIELVEQPVAADDLDGMARVRREVGIPIFADEALRGPEGLCRMVDLDAVDGVVVKPIVVGGPSLARLVIEEATSAGLRALVTTSIESGIGLALALHLAATLPPGAPASGLATGGLLADDLVTEAPMVRKGRMTVPTGPGLGVRLDEAALARSAVGPLWQSGVCDDG
jgi:o-succinylbenzoate synthase